MKKIFPAVALIMLLLTSCGGEKEPAYDGEGNIPYPLGTDFTINLLDSTKKYLVCTVTLEIDDASMAATFDERIYRIDDIVNMVVRGKTLEQISASDAQKTIGSEIKDRINGEFNTETVQGVYFEKFYIY